MDVLQVVEMQKIFKYFDVDGGGSVSVKEIQSKMDELGFKISSESINNLKHQTGGISEEDEEITFPEFLVAMLQQTRMVSTHADSCARAPALWVSDTVLGFLTLAVTGGPCYLLICG